MTEHTCSASDPRWGQHGRDHKAEAILATMRLCCGRTLNEGLWLDIGCGSGGIAATLAMHVSKVVGIDPEPWVRWQSFREAHPNLGFHVGSYRQLAELLGTASADVVVCNQVYEHVDDPAALLRAIHQVMKPGAVCYFAGPNLLWPIEPHVFWPFVHWLPRQFAQACMRNLGSGRASELDAWLWPYGKLVRHFRKVGFRVSNVVHERVRAEAELSGRPTFKLAAKIPRWLVSALVPVAPGFVFLLEKPVQADLVHD